MTDFDYKKYSLEHLENWLHDALSCEEAAPQEIYDVIKSVVEEQYHYHKQNTQRCYELLAFLNGNGKGHIKSYDDCVDKVLSCDKDDSSPECKGAWDQFWESYYPEENFQETPKRDEYAPLSTKEITKVDGYSVDGQNHSDSWYEYDRNDPNRPNPFKKDKVVKWQLPVEIDGASGEYFVYFPDDLLEAASLKEGDTVEWVDNSDGSYILRKV